MTRFPVSGSRSWLVVLAVALIAALALAGCGGGGGGGGGAKQVTLTGTEFKFDPSTITVSKGQQVEVTLQNKGTTAHNFTIPDLNVKMADVQPGQSGKVTFTPDKTGTFNFDCSIPGHLDAGMKGQLVVQ